jgi:hypothetical protein
MITNHILKSASALDTGLRLEGWKAGRIRAADGSHDALAQQRTVRTGCRMLFPSLQVGHFRIYQEHIATCGVHIWREYGGQYFKTTLKAGYGMPTSLQRQVNFFNYASTFHV